MEYWKIELWETNNGVCRVDKDLLKKLRKKEQFMYKSLIERMTIYVMNPIEKILISGDLEKVKSEKFMWELKFHLRDSEVRFLGVCVGRETIDAFYALYAFKKKEQRINNQHKNNARNRVEEFISQYQKNELQRIF